MGGREKGGAGQNSGGRGGAAIAGGEEHAGEWETRPSSLCLCNREHRGREGVRANSPRPRERPEDAAEAVVAMAGGGKVPGARG